MFIRLQKAGLKVNARKSYFGAHKCDYLGYHITCDRVMPTTKKVEAIQALSVPIFFKQLRQFIGMINFYCDMWQKRAELLAPLTALTSKNVKYDWKDEHQKCFDFIKRVIGREELLDYPDFNAPFEIHTDASKLQIGGVISKKRQAHRFIFTKDEQIPTKLRHNWKKTPFYSGISQGVA